MGHASFVNALSSNILHSADGNVSTGLQFLGIFVTNYSCGSNIPSFFGLTIFLQQVVNLCHMFQQCQIDIYVT